MDLLQYWEMVAPFIGIILFLVWRSNKKKIILIAAIAWFSFLPYELLTEYSMRDELVPIRVDLVFLFPILVILAFAALFSYFCPSRHS